MHKVVVQRQMALTNGQHQSQNIQKVKHSKKICSVCGGHLISTNIPPRNWVGYYAYSSKVARKLCLLIGVRTLPFIRLVIYIGLARDKNCLLLYDS